MKRWMSWILVSAVLLGGCNAKPSGAGAKGNFTYEQVLKEVGRQEPAKTDWVAEQYATLETGISSELMDAIARPEHPDAEWRKDTALRNRIKQELQSWVKGEPSTGREENEIINNFVLVANGRILASHIAASEGDWPLALKSGLDAFDLAWEGFSTAPNLVGADFQLNMWIAADNLAQLSRRSEISQAQRKEIIARLEKARDEVPHIMSTVVMRDFTSVGVQSLTEMVNAGADAASIGAMIAPMDDPEIRTEKLKSYIASLKTPLETKATFDSVANAMEFISDSSHGLIGFSQDGVLLADSSKVWGVDLLNTSAEEWDASALDKNAVNAVGEMIKAGLLRKYVSATESGYVSQINFSAAIIRTGYEWFKVENKRDPKDLRELNLAIGTMVVDPASGKEFIVEWSNSLIKSQAEPLPKQLVLLNAIIQNGVPF
ncbi:MAG: hypothetical protein KF824_10835 [Fimbriimonadaceae bacterium]|nr:MAG: hypothetical protein KF824_10835 [Fimbriimonadaceae bacterium]